MNEVFHAVNARLGEKSNIVQKAEKFISDFSDVNLDELDWCSFCSQAKKRKSTVYAHHVLCELLNRNLFHGDYAEYLYGNLDIYNDIAHLPYRKTLRVVFSGEAITRQIVYIKKQGEESVITAVCLDTENYVIFSAVRAMIHESPYFAKRTDADIIALFGESFGEYLPSIESVYDFNGKTMFAQFNFFKIQYADNEDKKNLAIRFVISFYRWLVGKYQNHSFFSDSEQMSETLLHNHHLSYYVTEDYYFGTYDPQNVPYGKHKACLIVRGMDSISTEATAEITCSYNVERIESDFYRNLVIEYLLIGKLNGVIRATTLVGELIQPIQALLQAKAQKGYANPDPKVLVVQEAVFLRNYIRNTNSNLITANNKLKTVKQFLQYCSNRGLIQTDDIFFEQLVRYGEPKKNTAKAVPEEHLVLINAALESKSRESMFYREMYIIFHLALQTELRISEICHLRIDAIKPTVKPGCFALSTVSKTSHGREKSNVLSDISYRLLMNIIEDTHGIRERTGIASHQNYIFVYSTGNLARNATSVFSADTFSETLKAICRELDIPEYTASNLRDTHMTKAMEYIMRTGKSDAEMAVLSRHKHIDTTKNYYIEIELEKMLEATHGVAIGVEHIDADSKVVDSIPEHLRGKDSDVENGCGKCTAENCVALNALPCMACKHFITTEAHEIFFKKAIDNVNNLIEAAPNRHDKEDLVTVKEMYVLYLKAIAKHKEGVGND